MWCRYVSSFARTGVWIVRCSQLQQLIFYGGHPQTIEAGTTNPGLLICSPNNLASALPESTLSRDGRALTFALENHPPINLAGERGVLRCVVPNLLIATLPPHRVNHRTVNPGSLSLQPERPGQSVETDAGFVVPPAPFLHRIENWRRAVFGEGEPTGRFDLMDPTPFQNERPIEAHDVVANDSIRRDVKSFHPGPELSQDPGFVQVKLAGEVIANSGGARVDAGRADREVEVRQVGEAAARERLGERHQRA